MLEVYSDSVVAPVNGTIPLDSTSLQKGCTAVRSGLSTIQLNKCGVYEVTLDGYVVAGASGTITVQMRKDGVIVPQAITKNTAADTVGFNTIGFTTLVQVDHNNSNCCCASPTIIDFLNLGVALTSGHVNVTVTKIC